MLYKETVVIIDWLIDWKQNHAPDHRSLILKVTKSNYLLDVKHNFHYIKPSY